MSSIKALTGGTRDVNPQTLGSSGKQTAVNGFVVVEVAVPVLRVTQRANVAQVIEILAVDFEADFGERKNNDVVIIQLTSARVTQTLGIQDFRVIAHQHMQTFLNTEGRQTENKVTHIDLTDGAGHGLICATPSIFLVGASLDQATALLTFRFRIFYRFKNIGLTEFIGIAIQQAG